MCGYASGMPSFYWGDGIGGLGHLKPGVYFKPAPSGFNLQKKTSYFR